MNKIELCKNIKDNIGKLSNNEILEIFKIVNDNNTKYTRNNNGIFINLKWMDEDILNKINDYIAFSIKSQNEMIKYEEIKNSLTDTINFKDKNLIENIDLFVKKIKKKDYNYRILELEIINQQNDNISANNYINNIFYNL